MLSYKNHDKAKYGTIDFPVKYNHWDFSNSEYIIPVHWHKEWEIIRIKEGIFEIQIDGKEHTLNAGDIALIKGSSLHLCTPKNSIFEFIAFDIHMLFLTSELLKKHLRPFYRGELLPYEIYRSGQYNELSSIVDKLMTVASKHKSSSGFYELSVAAYICCFFAEILESELYNVNHNKNSISFSKTDQIKRSIEYIENHYQEPISLTDLALTAGMSPKYFCKIFKEITHQTPVDYVILYRVEQACILLSTTNTPIIDIAMECGFNDCSYFIRTFKKFKNMTPSQYRNR